MQLDAGEWLFREGDPGDAMYVVRAGRLEVVDGVAGAVIRELGRGDALGELALLTDLAPLGVGAGRAGRATCWRSIAEHFEELLHELAGAVAGPEPGARRAAAQRAGAGRQRARPRPATVALMSL